MYATLGASPRQNVRNPFPMTALVDYVLPAQRVPPTVEPWETRLGLVHGNTQKALDRWHRKALTVQQIMDRLQAKGFIVSKPNVIMALRLTGAVARRSSRFQLTKTGYRYVSFCRYAKAK